MGFVIELLQERGGRVVVFVRSKGFENSVEIELV